MTAATRVLCVDDELDTAQTTAELLRLAGCDARACRNGVAALAVARGFRPDVCVIDLSMPGMDGDALAKHLREWGVGPGVRLVALTGRGDAEAEQLTRDAGFDAHLVKPADPERLIAAVIGRPVAV